MYQVGTALWYVLYQSGTCRTNLRYMEYQSLVAAVPLVGTRRTSCWYTSKPADLSE